MLPFQTSPDAPAQHDIQPISIDLENATTPDQAQSPEQLPPLSAQQQQPAITEQGNSLEKTSKIPAQVQSNHQTIVLQAPPQHPSPSLSLQEVQNIQQQLLLQKQQLEQQQLLLAQQEATATPEQIPHIQQQKALNEQYLQTVAQYQQQPHLYAQTVQQLQQQVAAQQPIAIAIALPNTDANGIKLRKWESDIFACGDSPVCCGAFFFPCCVVGQIAHRMGTCSYITATAFYFVLSGLNIFLQLPDSYYVLGEILHSLFSFIGSVAAAGFLYSLRTSIRTRFDMRPDPGMDCFYSFCCGTCSIIQMAEHIKSYNPESCLALGAAAELPGYTE